MDCGQGYTRNRQHPTERAAMSRNLNRSVLVAAYVFACSMSFGAGEEGDDVPGTPCCGAQEANEGNREAESSSEGDQASDGKPAEQTTGQDEQDCVVRGWVCVSYPYM